MKKIIAALLICISMIGTAVAGPHYYGGRPYYHGGYYRPYHRDHFVAGLVTGAIIGGVIMQPRPVYVQPPVYYTPAYQYVRQWDSYCQCYVTVRRAVDPYNPGY
jgi:hypothetical protein